MRGRTPNNVYSVALAVPPLRPNSMAALFLPSSAVACPSRIRCQAATGSWTKSRQWETQRTLFSSARATMCPPAKVNGVWPFNDAWLRTSLEEARRQAPRNVASILNSARELRIRDAQAYADGDLSDSSWAEEE